MNIGRIIQVMALNLFEESGWLMEWDAALVSARIMFNDQKAVTL